MTMSWSHAVLYVRDQQKMIDFYTQVLGFEVTDQGPLGRGDAEITFLSQDPSDHHQLAMIGGRQDEEPSNSVNHFAFRVGELEEVTDLNQRLSGLADVKVSPMSHGNTLSIYFNDPEGNGIEVFWDTPWHVAQPQGKPWDITLSKDESLRWVKETFSDEPSFGPRDDYFMHRHLV